jgi:hydroxyacylglutathione hydrolase
MLRVEQFRYNADNFTYLFYGKSQAIAIDGGAVDEIIRFLDQNCLALMYVTNTHQHFDHTSGNEQLLKKFQVKFLDFADLSDNKEIKIDSENILIYRTPGHTDDSICLHAGNILITGDTLFNGTIGNCFSGNLKNFYLSIKRLMSLPSETMIFAGHDYVKDSLAFARYLEPENGEIDRFRNSYDFNYVYSTIAEERKINPYFRFNEAPIVALLQARRLPCKTEWERWQSLMSIE